MGYHLSTCPYCSSGCGLLLNVEDDRLLSSHPSVTHPVARGSLCMRGWNCVEARSDRDRLTHALVRRDGRLVPTSARAAVEEVAARLNLVRSPAAGRARGPRRRGSQQAQTLFVLGPAVANEDLVAAGLLARFLSAGVCGAETSGVPVARRALNAVLGQGYSARTLDVLGGADVIWLFGVDADNYPQIASRLVRARRNGATLVQFDIYQAATAPGRVAIAVPPGRFPIVPLLLQRAAFDADAVPPRLRSVPQFATLARPLIGGRDPLAGDHDWLTNEQARDIVRAFRAARSPAVVVGDRWLSSVAGEEQTIQLLQALVLLGAQDRVVMAAGEVNSWGSADLLQPNAGREMLLDLLDPAAVPSIRTLVIVGDDLLRSAPRPDVLARRFPDIESIVVIDRFETACVSYAHVVLPSAVFAELDGTVTNSLGMVQRWRRVVAPPGDARAEREWFEAIGWLVGMHDLWDPALAGLGKAPERGSDQTARWLHALASQNPAYHAQLIGQLYSDPAATAVRLEERGRVSFVEPWIPSAAVHRPPEFPMVVHFRRHPAAWSTGVLSGREQMLKREVRESTVRLSPRDVEGAGLRDGSAAKVVTPYGDAVLTVRADPSLPDGVSLVTMLPDSRAASRRDISAATMAADGGDVSLEPVSPGLQGFYPDADRQALAVEPVPGRIEKV